MFVEVCSRVLTTTFLQFNAPQRRIRDGSTNTYRLTIVLDASLDELHDALCTTLLFFQISSRN
jgi:hypothetical protein